MENPLRRVVPWEDDSTKLSDYVQLIEDDPQRISFCKSKFHKRPRTRWVLTPLKITRNFYPGYLLSTSLQYSRGRNTSFLIYMMRMSIHNRYILRAHLFSNWGLLLFDMHTETRWVSTEVSESMRFTNFLLRILQ